ncbi:hypothetical protein CLHUN_41980 [Ruminiclostridium hungatei]|uniref:Peptidase C-terminal archaeal/bacterial domain-containing protein n=1 Tax=Ruminiclostridium hungatei TaxID=48256 RepID=A0A1V4SDL3_RUMHU|nr:hypothetical protein [Ruminiclostridium hungatei]OPX41938.1 hypothetical protein CLHUN_41980 [Ruminiclostridium hungatei]
MKRKLLSLALVLVMVFTVNISAFATTYSGNISNIGHITGSNVIPNYDSVEYTFYLSQDSYYDAKLYIPIGYGLELRNSQQQTVSYVESDGTLAEITKNSIPAGIYKLVIWCTSGHDTGTYNIYQSTSIQTDNITNKSTVYQTANIPSYTAKEYTFYVSNTGAYNAQLIIPDGYGLELRNSQQQTIRYDDSDSTGATISVTSLPAGVYKLIVWATSGSGSVSYTINQSANW